MAVGNIKVHLADTTEQRFGFRSLRYWFAARARKLFRMHSVPILADVLITGPTLLFENTSSSSPYLAYLKCD